MVKKIFYYLLLVAVILSIFLSGCDYIPEAGDCESNDDCKEGYLCEKDGKCHVCGRAAGSKCCRDNTCAEGWLACYQGYCRNCGIQYGPCCADDYCGEDLECGEDNLCHGCGEMKMPCCDGKCESKGLCCYDDNICHLCVDTENLVFGENDSSQYSSGTGGRG